MYEYAAKVSRVIDGDTVDVDIDLGLDTHVLTRLRLMGINAPEHGTPEGEAATEYVRNWVHNHAGPGGLVVVVTVKDRKEKYGRYLAYVRGWVEEAEEFVPIAADRVLNEMLLTEGHAVSYDGGAR